jgi:SPP1 gp7 family putative phage head morphogenesis protein
MIKNPAPMKTAEREFEQAFEYMVEYMSRLYQKQVIEALNQSTVEKFADAQTGNFAAVLLALAKKATRKLKKRFDDDRIKRVVAEHLRKTDKRSQAQLYSQIEKVTGVSATQLAAEEALKAHTNALILETAEWAKKLRDETLELYTANTLRVMTLGTSLDGVMDEFAAMKEKRKDHAKFTARNQINNFNAIMGKTRAQNLGIRKAIWVTAQDERVRPSHEARNGKIFNLDEGLYSSIDGQTILPGAGSYNCRCSFSFVLDDEDE